jgi:hypothetical protein
MQTLLRVVIILLLAAVAVLLVDYAPLIPKLITLVDDVHSLRDQAPGIKKSIDETRAAVEKLEKRIPSWVKDDGRR